MEKNLNNFRFTVKPSYSEGENALELARTLGIHPLTYQELPFDPEYSIYAGRLTPEKLNNATAEEMYWKIRKELIFRHTGEHPLTAFGHSHRGSDGDLLGRPDDHPYVGRHGRSQHGDRKSVV